MALPNFFDKAALAASHVLQGFDLAAFEGTLQARVVGIAFDTESAISSEGRATLELAVNLLSRLYPRLAIVPTGDDGKSMVEELQGTARAINAEIEIARDLGGVSLCLTVGSTRPATDAPIIYVGSDGWIARLSPDEPVGSGRSRNPFGAGAAACFGAANIFRMTFADHLLRGAPDGPFALSLLDYEPNTPFPGNPDLGSIDLGDCFLVGLGAIGNGAIWALAKAPLLRGTLHLVDHEAVELTNLQRYVLPTQADVAAETPKVTLAARALHETGLTVRPHRARWGDFLRGRGDFDLRRVAVAVDSAEDRRAVQAALPRWIANAWTQTGDLGISRHDFLGDQACLMCLYLPDEKQADRDKVIAQAIGLPEAFMEVRERLYRNDPVGRSLIERIAASRKVPVESLLAFEGKTLGEFYSEAVCGGILLRLGGGDEGGHTEVPMAFQSALAGIMLAAELVAHAGDLKQAPPVTTSINLLRPLGMHLSQRRKKGPSGRCICQDRDYVNRYAEKYGMSGW